MVTADHTEHGPRNGAPDGAPGESSATEVDLLLRLARQWRQLGMLEAAEHGLTPHQERALLGLARLARKASPHSEGVRVSALADQLGIAPRSATEVADALESAGLIARSPDPTDRRAVLLSLTPVGRHTLVAVRDRRRVAADKAVASLSPADRAELRRLLQSLLHR